MNPFNSEFSGMEKAEDEEAEVGDVEGTGRPCLEVSFSSVLQIISSAVFRLNIPKP